MLFSHPSTEHGARHKQGSKDRNNRQQAEATEQPSVDEWTKKMGYIHTVGYDSALKLKIILSYTTTWMDLEDLMLKEISQAPGLLSPFM